MGTLPVLLLLVGAASLSAPAGRAVRRSAPHAPAPRDPVAVAIKSELEADALLLTEPALAAFVEAEVRAFLDARAPDESGACAALARAARDAYVAASREEGLLSNHGSLLSFVRTELSAPSLAEPLSRAACAPFDVSRHTVDMLHHRLFRGAATKTATPSGAGESPGIPSPWCATRLLGRNPNLHHPHVMCVRRLLEWCWWTDVVVSPLCR